MNTSKIIKILIIVLCLCLVTGIGLFLYNSHNNYNINSGFVSLPLKFNPNDSSSSYSWSSANITIYGGFVKGIQKDTNGGYILVLRALSPLPTIELKSSTMPVNKTSIYIENINPDFYAKSIANGFGPERTALNTLKFTINLKANEKKIIKPTQPSNTESSKYIVLGDSRDGYETFDQIIEQVDAQNPVFVIDNGDLVFSGKPNQYRLFDQMAFKFASTLCTTLGNHDIRGSGLETYTKLYGPKYYSFDFGNNHFAFVDSSPGWSQKQAISEEQYTWLEKDLTKAKGKRIFVITHILPKDPRSAITPNKIPYYTDKVNQGNSFFERKLDAYSENETMDHGFQDKQEAERFEKLMAKYKVDIVYLSHLHSYFDYNKDGVRYIISGGAGAELLTKNSYYHYLITKTDSRDSITMVQLPSPANLLMKRYQATASLFLEAMYDENKAAVIFFIIGFLLLVLLLLILLFIKFNQRLSLLWILLKDTGKYTSKRFKELFKGDKKPV